jgi:hypothetical protein
MGAYSYSGTAASNTTVDGIGAAGSDSPDNIDNLVRALAASDANLVRDLGGANTVAGTADAITVALADASTPAYFDGMVFSFRAASDTTVTGPTLNVDSLGAKTIKKTIAGVESALVVGDIQAGGTYQVVYRSAWASAAGAWELLNPASLTGISAVISGDVAIGTTAAAARLHVARNSDGGVFRAQRIGGTNLPILQINITEATAETEFEATGAAAGPISFKVGGSQKLKIGTTGAWDIASVAGSNGQVVKQVAGATAWGGVSTFETVQATTSGTTKDFTIPSWVREIDVIFDEVSFSSTDGILVQIGPSGTPETTSYVSTSVTHDTSSAHGGGSATTGFFIHGGNASNILSAIMTIKNITGNQWIASHAGKTNTTTTVSGAGRKTTASAINILRVTGTAGNTFDAGQVNICYR